VGGFGLLTIDGLPKPGYHAYQLLHKLGAAELPATREDDGSGDREAGNLDCWATRSEGGYQVLLATYTPPALEGAPPARPVAVRAPRTRDTPSTVRMAVSSSMPRTIRPGGAAATRGAARSGPMRSWCGMTPAAPSRPSAGSHAEGSQSGGRRTSVSCPKAIAP